MKKLRGTKTINIRYKSTYPVLSVLICDGHVADHYFSDQWYFFYHDGSYSLNGTPGGDCRRSVCVEYLYFNPDGTIKPITLTPEGVRVPPLKIK